MSEQPKATDPTTSAASPVPCAICDSTMHTTGHHEGGAPGERKTDGGMSPMGHHEGGITAETAKNGDEKKPAGVAGGHHEGGSPERK
jgi:hypothetical protein